MIAKLGNLRITQLFPDYCHVFALELLLFLGHIILVKLVNAYNTYYIVFKKKWLCTAKEHNQTFLPVPLLWRLLLTFTLFENAVCCHWQDQVEFWKRLTQMWCLSIRSCNKQKIINTNICKAAFVNLLNVMKTNTKCKNVFFVKCYWHSYGHRAY